MKVLTLRKKLCIVYVMLLGAFWACGLDFEPYDSLSSKSALADLDGLQTATNGTYAAVRENEYVRHIFREGELGGDNVACSNPAWPIYDFVSQSPAMWQTFRMWNYSYKVIYNANSIIEGISDNNSPAIDQLKGENLFLRALAHFNLVRVYGRPYPQNQGENLGIVIKDNTLNEQPQRSSVKETYDFIIGDLLRAAELMTESKNSCYASKETAYALLSRVYLYKEDNENAILYAEKVINSGRYQLMETEAYKKYFTIVPESNSETIFAIRFTAADNALKNAIGSIYYNDPITQASGWGELYASTEFIELLGKYPLDARHSFIEPQTNPDGTMKLRNGVPMYFVNKFNYQEGVVNLSSPVFLRLAEMYLNRAEANAKLGTAQGTASAIEDVNLIRRRAGLSGSALYSVSDLKGHESVLDVVLEERRLELAFEAQRPYDLFRNSKPLVRNYPGFHGDDNFHLTINPDHPRVVYYLPDRELIVNQNLLQNP